MTGHTNWLDHSTRLLSLPKELLLEIITSVALESTNPFQIFPTSLIELSQCCKYLYHLVHEDHWRLQTLWPVAFHHRFDTAAIYRRRLNTNLNWQAVLERRCKALYQCRSFASKPNEIERLNTIDWEVIWDMITEHGKINYNFFYIHCFTHFYDRSVQHSPPFKLSSSIRCWYCVSIGPSSGQGSLSCCVTHFIAACQLWYVFLVTQKKILT